MEWHLIKKNEVTSTNDVIKELAREGVPEGTAVAADRQTKGRGRRGRVWESPQEDNIYLSFLLRPKMEPQYVSMLTLVAALSVVNALAGMGQDKWNQTEDDSTFQIKWPNDIVWKDKKICGILTEMSMEAGGGYYCVIGIGINVNTEKFPPEISHMATSLRRETGLTFDREPLIRGVLEEFEKLYSVFLQKKSLAPFLAEYNKHLINRGRKVRILSEGKEEIGVSEGIDETGVLLVRKENGRIEKVISGEVSVRGLYGYV